MNILRNSAILIFAFIVFASCSKGSTNNGNTQTAPTNLVVTATPSVDGSGNVSFTATANNAVTYTYEYGDGIIEPAQSGVISHRYTQIGSTTYTVIVTAKSSGGLTISKSINVTVNVIASTPVLIFSDEFNVDGMPDATKWGYDIGTGSGGWGNNELEYYTNRSQNAFVQNGVLKITAIKENYSGSAYTSARLLSKDKFSFKYGKVEVSAKLPAGVGTWPAIWMLGANVSTTSWPACGEIDIMEHLGRDLNKIYGTLHYPGHSGGNADGATTMISNATTAFHKYTLEWSSTEIKFYVDDVVFKTFANNASVPFNQNFFMILNMAMGGNFGGAVDPAFTNASMEIDYIRVYQ